MNEVEIGFGRKVVRGLEVYHSGGSTVIGKTKQPALLLGDVKLEAISKMSFGPISLLVPRFKFSKYGSIPPV